VKKRHNLLLCFVPTEISEEEHLESDASAFAMPFLFLVATEFIPRINFISLGSVYSDAAVVITLMN
jgi:hypothetical protein